MVKSGHQRRRIRAEALGSGCGRLLRSPVLAAASALFVAGCPQLLEDDFELDTGGVLEPSDTTAPTVTNVTPGDGLAGVSPEMVIVITFSEPMDRGSVENAYTSSALPKGAVSFSWSESDSVLQITPDAPLTVASGSDPGEVEPARYEFDLTSAAQDVSGNALVPKHVEFFTIREITRTLRAVQDRSLTGSWRSDDIYGTSDCEQVDTTVCVGDSSVAGEPTYKGFATFDLGGSSGGIGVSAATLSLEVRLIVGAPFPDLGSLSVEHVNFDAIGAAAFSSQPQSLLGTMASSAQVGDTLGVDVAGPVSIDLRAQRHSQFRLSFSSATDQDGRADVVVSDWSTLTLSMTYRTP